MSKKKDIASEKNEDITISVDNKSDSESKKSLVVADGQRILCKGGLKHPGDKITAENLGGGQAALDRLKETGKIV